MWVSLWFNFTWMIDPSIIGRPSADITALQLKIKVITLLSNVYIYIVCASAVRLNWFLKYTKPLSCKALQTVDYCRSRQAIICFGKVFPVWNFPAFYFMHANCPNRDGNQSSFGRFRYYVNYLEHFLNGNGRVFPIMMMKCYFRGMYSHLHNMASHSF